VVDVLAGIAASAHKAATDLRILAHRKEIEEPFEKQQIGSSAMAYKRNPMRCERICGLSRFVMSLQTSPPATLATQWMERTLDDSANRRLVLPQAFLAIDAVLLLYRNVAEGLVVYPAVIAKNLREELPFMATENILMAAVAAGGDRQELHERIRVHSQAAAAEVKQHGRPNDLLGRLAGDKAFAAVDLNAAVDPHQLIGRSAEQVEKAGLRAGRPFRAAGLQLRQAMFDFGQIEREIVRPQRGPLAHGGRLGGLQVGKTERRQVSMRLGKAGQCIDRRSQSFGD
jgi:adenylosuccinate lyase